MAADYYKTLGVAPGATPEEIEAAYDRLGFRLRPKLGPENAAATDDEARIENAYAILSNPEKRAQYDAVCAAFPEADGPGEEPVADATLPPDESFSVRLAVAWCLVVGGPASAASGALGAYVLRDHYNRFLAMLVPGSADQTLYFAMIAAGIVAAGFGSFLFMLTDDEWWSLIGAAVIGDKPRGPYS